MDKSKRARILLLYAFMYVGGPLLWGGWMIFRLELLSPAEYARCLLSPLTLVMLAAFLAGSIVNVHRAASTGAQPAVADLRSILRTHCVALLAFGTAGTFVFLYPPGAVNAGNWLFTAAIGSLSGAALVFLVYGYFTVVIFRLITRDAEILRCLRRFYSMLFPLGAVIFVTAVALAGGFRGLTPLGGASLALPLASSGLLFARTMSRTGVTHEAS